MSYNYAKNKSNTGLIARFREILLFLGKESTVIPINAFIPKERRRKHGIVTWKIDKPGVFCYTAWDDDIDEMISGQVTADMRVLEEAYNRHYLEAKERVKQMILEKQIEEYIIINIFKETI